MTDIDPKYLKFTGGELSPEQIEGVSFLINNVRGILAFQTGLGKTLVALTSMKILIEKHGKARGIIVCPPKATKIFKKELTTKLGFKRSEIGILSAEEQTYSTKDNKVFIFTTTMIDTYGSLILDLAVTNRLILLLDEAHQLQESESKFYQSMLDLRTYFTAIWFATATPILNDLDSLYNIVTFLDPNFFGTKTQFLDMFTVSRLKTIYLKGGKKRKVRETLGYQNLPILKKALESICIMRQIKYNLKFAHMSKRLSDEEMSVYERVSKGIMGEEEKTFGQRLHDLQRLVDNSYVDELVNELDSTKEKMLFETLASIIAKNYSVVIYADYLDTIARLELILEENQKALGIRKIFKITGSVDLKVREQVEDSIIQRDIILVTRAGTESINLQKANCIIMYDIPYSIKDCIQLIGRVTRMDTKFDCQYIITICTEGTIDEYKYLLFKDYSNLVKQILGSDANLPEDLQEIDRKNLQQLKDRLLWHYKDAGKQEINKKRKLLRSNMIVCKSSEVNEHVATYIINLNPESIDIPNSKRMAVITPNKNDYQCFLEGKLPFTVLKNRYIDSLKSPEGKTALSALVIAIIEKRAVVVLVDDYEIGNILKTYILDNVNLG